MDSFFHKSEIGNVAIGSGGLVTGDAVAKAITEALRTFAGQLSGLINERLPGLLENRLSGFIDAQTLQSRISGLVTMEWLANQLSTKVDASEFTLALRQKVSFEDIVGTDLSPYALKTELPDTTLFARKEEIPDVTGFATRQELTTMRSEINTALAARATAADVATAKQEAIDAAATNTSNMCAMPTDFDANGVFIGKTPHIS